MSPNSAELTYLIAIERQGELLADAQPSGATGQGLVDRLREALAR